MNSVLANIKDRLAEMEAKRKEMVEEIRKEFPNLLKPLFERSELIKSISWTQYTPYFNDGDECTFRVSHDININGEYKDDISWYSWKYKYFVQKGEYKEESDEWNLEECAIVEEIEKVLENIPENFYKDLFGDHCEVTVNSDGTISVDEYEHD